MTSNKSDGRHAGKSNESGARHPEQKTVRSGSLGNTIFKESISVTLLSPSTTINPFWITLSNDSTNHLAANPLWRIFSISSCDCAEPARYPSKPDTHPCTLLGCGHTKPQWSRNQLPTHDACPAHSCNTCSCQSYHAEWFPPASSTTGQYTHPPADSSSPPCQRAACHDPLCKTKGTDCLPMLPPKYIPYISSSFSDFSSLFSLDEWSLSEKSRANSLFLKIKR